MATLDEQLCNVRVLESGRHVVSYWSFQMHSVLRKLRDDATQQRAAHQTLELGDAASADECEGFDNRREAFCEARDETTQLFSESSLRAHAVCTRSYAGQTLFDLALLQTTFATSSLPRRGPPAAHDPGRRRGRPCVPLQHIADMCRERDDVVYWYLIQ